MSTLALCGVLSAVAQPSSELTAALAKFRTEGPKGWAFTQTSESEEFSRVEAFDPLRAQHLQWDLLLENGETPSASVLERYRQQQTRRTGGQTAPNVKEQLDYDTARLEHTENGREHWHFRLKPGAEDDRSAPHMEAHLVFHVASATIEQIELANFESFSPVFGVQVETARTLIRYSLPEDDTPTLLQEITVSMRGRAFFFKSLDSDMKVVYSDHEYRGKKPQH